MSRDGDILDYVLGDADADERGRIVAMSQEDDDLARELETLSDTVAALTAMPGEAWSEVSVPPLPDLRRGENVTGTADEGGGVILPFRRRVSMPRFAAVAASLALVASGIGIGALMFDGGDDAPAPAGPAIALESFGEGSPDAQGIARTISAGVGDMVLDVSGLAPSSPGEFYTAWLIDTDGGLQALGSFRVPEGGTATVSVPLPVDIGDFALVDVSVEAPDGDTGHSGRSVLRGEISGT
jgi:hypothetical protein